jgi:DNA-binding CsgD family transcriptional regulator
MPAELQRAATRTPGHDETGRALIERGADLVYLTEELYLRLFILTLLLTAIGCVLSVWFAVVSSRASVTLTVLIAAVALVLTTVGLARPRLCYCWLRYDRARQLSPALPGIIAVLCNGPDSPSWWVALPLLWVIAAVSSTRLSLAAAIVTSGAFLAGTLIGGEPLVHSGDAEILGAAVALPANILIGRLVAEVFTRFVLRLHQLERDPLPTPRPVRVGNVGVPITPRNTPKTAPPTLRHEQPRRLTRLTSRELEALLLVRDGLLHAEVALALGISSRQVERLLASARTRTKATTTSQLVAELVTGHLAP